MSQDDPFAPYGDEDKTIIRPMPGGRRRPDAAPAPAAPPIGTAELDAQRLALFGENPLVTAALSLLSLSARLRNTASHGAISELQQQLVNELRTFENKVLQQGIPQDQVRIANYILCCLLDETILNTPWGAQSIWGHQSLLILFHKEAWGGEKFFQILAGLVRQPAQNLYLLELFYLCVSLGFEGKHRIMANGLNALEQTRIELYQLIQRVRGDYERELSPRWQGLKDARNALIRYVPLWVVGAVAGALLILVYLGFALAINGASDPAYKELFALSRAEIKTAEPLPPPPPPVEKPAPGRAERFKVLLAPEIAKDWVEVIDDHTLRIRNSFASGSDQVKKEFLPMLNKIGQEVATGRDAVLVTGHTDDKPIVSARFPSNWHLSTARAKHVADILVALGAQVRAEGRADGEPLVPNDTPEHRALNRRVDILIR
ncbi:type IVB secretion system protein IcmH/DotU [Methylococcus sp. EFPC2]|uniref:type IVB secretion system protein IcmH/DotU n=1 Tax=Methylococcus sp. EFPC2 TaxID=2812648 RepID=UPI001967A285|nr:type IVB secretion system protein IcmH/DotU [Methylococcus sp. EFPC2]QSA96408.1 type IVB secretion system protein IcmH/DotU [Methylococcus sp. EFPC2]